MVTKLLISLSFSHVQLLIADFTRAVKACTGQTLNSHVIHVVFQLFDVDGDGRLSHREFISVMKERIHRGAKVNLVADCNYIIIIIAFAISKN